MSNDNKGNICNLNVETGNDGEVVMESLIQEREVEEVVPVEQT